MPEVIREDQAVLNITWDGQNGELPDPILNDATDVQIRQWAAEAIRGGIPGITADEGANLNALADNVIFRYPATADLPNRIMLRPKTAFGRG